MDPLFEVHELNEEGFRKARLLAEEFNSLLAGVEALCLPGSVRGSRDLAIVRTKLEEACFFAKKAMASQVENQRGGS